MNKLKFTIIIMSIITFSGAAMAANPNDKWSPNWGVPNYNPYDKPAGEDSEQIWDNERTNIIENNFGSQDSPGFLNTQDAPTTEYNQSESPDQTEFEDSPYEGGE